MTHVTPFKPQLGDGPYGPFDCTANSAAMGIDNATGGAKSPSGAQVRNHSDEPVPDPKSPGLNLPQVAAVADWYGVHFDVRIGPRAVAWAEYEERRMAGQGCLLQLLYKPIADGALDAGGGFTGNHCVFETQATTYDPLADGRRAGIHKFNGILYPRTLMLQSGASLDLGGGKTPLPGRVWAAFTKDVTPQYRVAIHPKPGQKARFARFSVFAGRIVDRSTDETGGFTARSTPPTLIYDPLLKKYVYLVQLLKPSSRAGEWIRAGWAKEV